MQVKQVFLELMTFICTATVKLFILCTQELQTSSCTLHVHTHTHTPPRSVKVIHPLQLNIPSVQVNNNNPTNTSPVVATNTTATQEQVGNVSGDSHTLREIHQTEDNLPAPSSLGLITKGTNAATNYLKGSQDHGEWLEMPKLQQSDSGPDNEQGKWENRSESSHSSFSKDDMPLLQDY